MQVTNLLLILNVSFCLGSQEYFAAFESYIQFVFHADVLSNPALKEAIEQHARKILETGKDECILMFVSHVADNVAVVVSRGSKMFTLTHSSWISEASVMYPCALERDEIFHIVETTVSFLGCPKVLTRKVFDHFPDYKFSFEEFLSELFTGIESADRPECCLDLFNAFMTVDQKIVASVNNKRQHVGSAAFKRRFRLWSHVCQVLLKLPPRTENESSIRQQISASILNRLHQDTTDPSLRLMIEMALASVLSLQSWADLIPDNLTDLASSFVTSLIHAVGLMFLTQVNHSNIDSVFEKLDACLLFLSKWATVAHNNIRTSAQIFFVKIFNHMRNFPEFSLNKMEKFKHFEAMVLFWSDHAKFETNISKSVAAVYYFYDFSAPIGYYEGVKNRIVERFEIEDNVGKGRNFEIFDVADEDQAWACAEIRQAGFSGDTNVSEGFDNDAAVSTSQLKPVTSLNLDQLFENEYKLMQIAHTLLDNEEERPGNLILIASLLEKMTNIGGLCRTGEVQVRYFR